jgi:hypothetical protein
MIEIGLQFRLERERRKLPRADVSRAINVFIHHIAALEHGDYDHLPDDAIVAGMVRSYAAYLDLDPDAAVADFARQRGIEPPPVPEARPADAAGPVKTLTAPVPPEEGREPIASELPSTAAEPAPVEADTVPLPEVLAESSGKRIPLLPILAACVLSLVVALWLGLRGTSDSAPPATSIEDPGPGRASGTNPDPAAQPKPSRSAATGTVAPATAEPAPVRPASPPPDNEPTSRPPSDRAAAPSVTEYGVGTGVKNHRLVGESDRFEAGAKVWFWTRVSGGSSGDTIRHVWLHEGRVIDATTLRIGGSNWRTQSAKTLYSEGSWAVEARDEAGRVLARSEIVATRQTP